MDIDGVERPFAHHRILHHHHPRDPEEDDVEAGDQNAGREIAFQFLGILGPAERTNGPQAAGKPGVQHIGVAPHRKDQPRRVLIDLVLRQARGQRMGGRMAVLDLDHPGMIERHRQGRDHIVELRAHAVEIGRGVVPLAAADQIVGGQKAQHLDLVERAVALVIDKAVEPQVEAVPDRDAMAPPELARDAPGLDILQPVEIHLTVLVGQDVDMALAHRLDRRADDLFGIDEPLIGQHRLDHDLGPVAKGLHDRLLLDKGPRRALFVGHGHRQPLGGDVGDDALPCLEPVEPAIGIGHQVDRIDIDGVGGDLAPGGGPGDIGAFVIGQPVFAHPPGGIHQPVKRDAIALGHRIIVEIMRAGDLHRARTKGRVGVIVGDDRDQPALVLWPHRDFAEAPDDGRIAAVIGMHRDRAIAQHGFGPGGGDGNPVALFLEDHAAVFVPLDIGIGLAARERIFEMPHMALDLDILDLQVRNGGFEMRVPVDQPLAAIDEPLVVEIDEDLDHRIVEIGALAGLGVAGRAAHGERLARPVAAGAQPFELAADIAAAFHLLLPDPVDERFAPHLGPAGSPLAAISRSVTIWVAMPAWSVPGCHSVSNPRIRCQRISTSCSVLLNACPICRLPVTLGGGITMQKLSAPGRAFAPARKAPAASHMR
jgi:hypothetical protein